VPLTIKENIYTRGDPAPIGTRAHEDAPPQPADAPAAARAREAGCVLARQDHHARLRHAVLGPLQPARRVRANPWRLDRNTSGSSSGAAAAAAAGYAPLHIEPTSALGAPPATHCGIFALSLARRIPVCRRIWAASRAR